MATDDQSSKKVRDRKKEYARRKQRKIEAEAERLRNLPASEEERIALERATQLVLLERRTKKTPTDADADIDFAYRNMALDNVVPLDAPSTSAWAWYVFSRTEPNEFLKICHKREDAKAKQAGTITNQRMEDDKRQQFALIDRIEKQLTIDVKAMVDDLMAKFPRDVLRACKKHAAEWKSFLAEECQ